MSPDLTVEQFAEQTQTHPKTIRRLCRMGRIPAYKIGSQWRVPRSATEELRNAHAVGNADRLGVAS